MCPHLLGDFQERIVTKKIENLDVAGFGLGGNLRHHGLQAGLLIDKDGLIAGYGGNAPAAVENQDSARAENLHPEIRFDEFVGG